jgi:hypothetical protein
VTEADATAWERDVALLVDMHRAWRTVLENCSPGALRRAVPVGGSLLAISLVNGATAHDVYHAGQIQLLKRMEAATRR